MSKPAVDTLDSACGDLVGVRYLEHHTPIRGREMAAPQILSPSDFQKWLRGRRREDALAIAARCALRALPLIAVESKFNVTRDIEPRAVLAAFRAGALALVASKYPTRVSELSAAIANVSVSARVGARVATVVRAAAEAAHVATAAKSADAFAAAVHAVDHASAALRATTDPAVFASADAEMWHAVQADVAELTEQPHTALTDLRLWAAGTPTWAEKAWTNLVSMLPVHDRWDIWVNWYEAVREGRTAWPGLKDIALENLEIEICTVPRELWDIEPLAANEAISHKIADAHVSVISPQGPGPRFELARSGQIVPLEYWEYDGSGNIPKRINSFLPLVRRAADDLLATLSPNDSHFLRRDVTDYLVAVNRTVDRIDWSQVYGLGLFVENAAAAADRAIGDRLIPPLEDPALAALESLRTLHSNLIMASGEGRALQEEADALRLTREQQQTLREDARYVADDLKNASDVAAPAAAATVARAAEQIGQGPHPERGSEFGLATIANLSIVLVSAATLASFVPVGATVAGVPGGLAGASVAWIGYEGLKKSKIYANATAALGGKYDELSKFGNDAVHARLVSLAPFRRFVRENEAPLRRIAKSTPRLHWMLRYIDFVVRSESERGS